MFAECVCDMRVCVVGGDVAGAEGRAGLYQADGARRVRAGLHPRITGGAARVPQDIKNTGNPLNTRPSTGFFNVIQ